MGNKHLLLRSFFICFSDSGIKQCWIAIIFILTQVICISCDRTLSQESIIDLYPEVISSPDLGTKVTAIDYVRLETKSNCNIGYIAKLMVVKDYILINNSGKQIVCFDLKGKFLLNIGQQGRGPGEYERIRDFTYDQASNKVYVLSSMNSIMVYTMGGEFIERIETQEGYATSIEVLNDKIVLHYDNSSGKSINRIAIYTANGEFLKNYQNQYLFEPWWLPVY